MWIIFVLALLSPVVYADRIVRAEGDKVQVIETQEMVREELTLDDVEREILAVRDGMRNIEEFKQHRLRNLQDRLLELDEIKSKFQPRGTENEAIPE